MPATAIDDCSIAYEVLGDHGPPLVLTAGGRNPMEMARALAEQPFWAARIDQNPANRARLLAQDPMQFARVMRRWQRAMRATDPFIGVSEDDLRRIAVPTAILAAAGDEGHPQELSRRAAQLIPGVEYIEDPAFQAEWPGLQRQSLANYEQVSVLPRLIREWLLKTENRRSGPVP